MRALRSLSFVLVVAATSVFARELPNYDAVAAQHSPLLKSVSAREAAAAMSAPGTTPQVDDVFGVPTFLWAQRHFDRALGALGGPSALAGPAKGRPEEAAARQHLGQYASLYHLTPDDVANTPVSSIHNTGKGAVIVTMRQTISGFEVFREELKVIMDQNLDLLAISGYISSATQTSFRDPINFHVPPVQAIGGAVSDLAGLPFDATQLQSHGVVEGGYEMFGVVPEKRGSSKLSQDIRMKKVLFHLPDGLEPAYYMEVYVDTGDASSDSYSYVISATDGSILFRNNLTAYDSFTYRVWASNTGAMIPFDGPCGNTDTPHPTGTPDGFQAPFVSPGLVTLQNGPISTNDPWLPAGSVETNGNNVDAYLDLFAPDGFSAGDFRANITSPNTFDRTYDTSLSPIASSEQQKAAITQLFYNVNFFHDWYYDAGFDEQSGNAQANNYGRGGLQNDSIRGEGQDNSGRNNANMNTPADGGRPRMQMFIFDGFAAHSITNNTAVPAIIYSNGTAVFGPRSFDVTADVVWVDDGVVGTGGSIHDGCETPFANAGALAGKIALIDRGGPCVAGFQTKVLNAQANGAIGVIIANISTSTNPTIAPGMAATAGQANPTIGVLSLNLSDGDSLRTSPSTVNARLRRDAALDRDGTIDNQVMAHEWGHYISNRLISNSNGLVTNMSRGFGEGWADFHAMLMSVREDDTLVPSNANFNGAYAMAGYVEGGQNFDGTNNQGFYYGIRRMPYSTDMTKNGLTFQHIQDGVPPPAGVPVSFWNLGNAAAGGNSEVHNTGEVWAQMLWECYASLLRDTLGATPRLTFQQAQARMKAYLVAAYKMTPPSPTLLEARDAVLTAARANDLTDYGLFWVAFAKRGAGTQAVSPDRNSATNIGVVESYISGNDLVFNSASFVDTTSCDTDKILDAGETATLAIVLKNVGGASLSGVTGTISSSTPGVTFPAGTTVTFGATTGGGTTNGGVQVALDPSVTGTQLLNFSLAMADPGNGLTPTLNFSIRGNVDELAAASATEDFEASTIVSPWAIAVTGSNSSSPVARLGFRRIEVAANDHRMFVPDLGEPADATLASPSLGVNAGTFSFTFRHRYSFEFSGTSFFDGGVIEISTDGGGTWTDIGSSATPGYNGAIALSTTNALSGRSAFVGQSAGYPAFITTTVNLGTTYALKSVRIRFRAASDANTGATGWDIDDVVFNNIANTPFPRIAVDPGCSARTTTTTLSSSPANPVPIGQRFFVTATVATSDASAPEGSVAFFVNGSATASATANVTASGQVSVAFVGNAAGTLNFTATYAPAYSGKSAGSSAASIPVVIAAGATTTVLTSSLNPSTYPQAVTLTATVTGPGTAPTGSVTFRDGTTTLGSPVTLASGVASMTLASGALSGGSHSLSATYNGATCCATSIGNLTQTVNPAATTTTLSSSNNPSSFGTAVTFTANVSGGATGSVTFMDGATSLGGGTLSSGVATLTTSALSGGAHSITASYVATANYAGSASAPLTQVVYAISSLTLTAPTATLRGSPFSVTIIVRDSSGSTATGYTGTVHFTSNDPAATLPSDYTFLPADAGTHVFNGVRLNTLGSHSVTSTDSVSASLTSTANVTVTLADDFNGDGHSDLLWSNPSNGNSVAWFMNDSSIVGSAGLAAGVSSWSIVGSGDFDHDGKSDLVWRNGTTGDTAIWLMNGTARTGVVFLPQVSSDWSIAGVGDFDGDGNPDLLWRSASSGTVNIWFMNGTAMTSGSTVTVLPSSWVVELVGDFDGNGKADIVLRSTISGEASIWFMNGAAMQSSASIGVVSDPNWHIVARGDYNGDGKLDLVWRHALNGTDVVWFMDGGARVGSGNLPAVSDPNWQIVGPR